MGRGRASVRRAHPRGGAHSDDFGGEPGWPTWDPLSNVDDRLLASAGLAPGIPFEATVGGWAAFMFWLGTLDSNTHFIGTHGSVPSSRGWTTRNVGGGSNPQTFRVFNGAGVVTVVTTANTWTPNAFNAVIVELDVAGGIIAATLNNGVRATTAIVGYTPPQAADICAIAGPMVTGTNTLGTVGGMHMAAGATGVLITSAQRAAFWSTFARVFGAGRFGEGGASDNPAADHKWIAHALADLRAGSVLAKQGTVNDRVHAPVLAY